MKKNIFTLIACGLCTFGLSQAQQIPVSEEEKEDAAVHNFPVAAEIAGSNLEAQKDAYLRDKGRSLGFGDAGTYLGWSEALINTSPSSIDFAQKRITAFERAFSDAKAEYVRTRMQQTTVTISRKLFNDDRDGVLLAAGEEKADGGFVRIVKKLQAVTEAKLDQILSDLGQDPEKISSLSVKQKRKLAEDSINKEVVTRSVQSLSGVIILKTFEDTNAVGVLIKQNSRYSDLAKAIASRNLVGYPSATDPSQDIAAKLDATFVRPEMYIPLHGVRIVTDESGNRALVSYGQWSPKVTRSDTQMKQGLAIQAARKIAYNQSLSYMIQFLNTTIAVEDTSKLADSNMINEFTEAEMVTEEETSAVGAMIDQFIKESSSAKIEGATTVKRWTANHPDTGHLIVGNVLYWSPLTQEAVRQKPKSEAEVVTSSASAEVQPVVNKVYKSVDFGDEDF